MRTGAAAGHCGFFHEMALYGSDEELLEIVVPFLTEGLEAGEPVLATFGERNAALVRDALGDPEGIEFVPAPRQYRNPTLTIADYRRRFAAHRDAGAAQVRVVGDVPHTGTGACWDAWARYEGAANHAYEEFPVWGLCPYDTRTAPDDVLEDVRRTHPFEALPGGRHRAAEHFVDPDIFLAGRPAPAPLDLQRRSPDVVLLGPSPAQARRAVAELARDRLGPEGTDDAVIAVSEVVANAHRHGAPPVRLEAWAAQGAVVVTVRDHGAGPARPLVGLVPQPPPVDGPPGMGMGLWLAGRLCTDLAIHHADGVTEVRLLIDDSRAP